MPTLPLPGPVVLSAGDLPVQTAADVLDVLPKSHLPDQGSTAVRDTLVQGLLSILLEYQNRAAYAAAQSDPGRATSAYEDGLFNDRSFHRATGELDEPFRTRGLAAPALVSPVNIAAAVNAILAKYTTIQCQILESNQDGMFLTDGSGTYFCTLGNAAPFYPDRLYPSDVTSNGGVFRPNADPGGSWIFPDNNGRLFVVRVPDLTSYSSTHVFVANGTNANGTETNGSIAMFLGNGSDTGGTESTGVFGSFIAGDTTTATSIYQSIIDTVEAIRGHGIRWQLTVDSALSSPF